MCVYGYVHAYIYICKLVCITLFVPNTKIFHTRCECAFRVIAWHEQIICRYYRAMKMPTIHTPYICKFSSSKIYNRLCLTNSSTLSVCVCVSVSLILSSYLFSSLCIVFPFFFVLIPYTNVHGLHFIWTRRKTCKDLNHTFF